MLKLKNHDQSSNSCFRGTKKILRNWFLLGLDHPWFCFHFSNCDWRSWLLPLVGSSLIRFYLLSVDAIYLQWCRGEGLPGSHLLHQLEPPSSFPAEKLNEIKLINFSQTLKCSRWRYLLQMVNILPEIHHAIFHHNNILLLLKYVYSVWIYSWIYLYFIWIYFYSSWNHQYIYIQYIYPARALTVGWGKTFCHNSETKSRKINPKVPNRPPSLELQTGHWRNFRAKIRKFWPKKPHLLRLTMFRPRPDNVVQKKKVPFYQIINGE